MGENAREASRVGTSAKVVLGLSVLVALAGQLFLDGSDFQAFWSAGRMVVDGRAASAYNIAGLGDYQLAAGFLKTVAFINPPPFLALVTPFGWLSYPLAKAVWSVSSFAVFAMSLRWLPREQYWLALAFPAGLVCIIIGQNGLLTGALVIGALGALPRHKLLAGALVGLLVIKPHLALLFPLALIAGREWRAFAAAAVTALAASAGSVAIFGWETASAFLEQTTWTAGILSQPNEHLAKMQSVYALVVGVTGSFPLAAALQGLAALGAGVLVWVMWRRASDSFSRAAVFCAATPLAVPYLFTYDVVFLAVPLAWLAREGLRRGLNPLTATCLSVAFLSPVAFPPLASVVPLVPFLACGLLGGVLVSLSLRRGSVDSADGADRSPVAAPHTTDPAAG